MDGRWRIRTEVGVYLIGGPVGADSRTGKIGPAIGEPSARRQAGTGGGATCRTTANKSPRSREELQHSPVGGRVRSPRLLAQDGWWPWQGHWGPMDSAIVTHSQKSWPYYPSSHLYSAYGPTFAGPIMREDVAPAPPRLPGRPRSDRPPLNAKQLSSYISNATSTEVRSPRTRARPAPPCYS